jgi:hypothetical protein
MNSSREKENKKRWTKLLKLYKANKQNLNNNNIQYFNLIFIITNIIVQE